MEWIEKHFTPNQLRFGYLVAGILLLTVVWYGEWSESTVQAFALAGVEEQLVASNNTLMQAAQEVRVACVLLAATLLACWLLNRSATFSPSRETGAHSATRTPRNLNTLWTLFGFLGVYLLYMGICIGQDFLGSFIASWLSPNDIVAYPRPTAPTAEHAQAMLLSAPTAGPTEEPFFAAALPLLARVLIRHNGWALATALGLSVTLRVAFHVYYDPATIPTFALWAAAAVLLWWFTGQLLALVCTHAVYNAISTLNTYPDLLPFNGDSASLLLIKLPALVFLALIIVKHLKGKLTTSARTLLRSGPATACTPVRAAH